MEQIKTKRVVIGKVLKISARVMFALFGAILLTVLILFFILLSWSSGKMKPFVDKNGHVIEESLSEKIFVEINGVKQGMIIKSKDEKNPVLPFSSWRTWYARILFDARFSNGFRGYVYCLLVGTTRFRIVL